MVNEEQAGTIVDDLVDFRNKLVEFISYRRKGLRRPEKLTEQETVRLNLLWHELSIKAGKYAPLIKECTGLESINTSAGFQDVWNWAFNSEPNPLVLNALDNCLQATSRTVGKIAEDVDQGIRDKHGKLGEKLEFDIETPKAFIAHGGESPALAKLKNLLISFGIEPLVIEEQPSKGKSVGEKVDWYARQADFAVILAEKGDKDTKTGQFIPRGNVLIEIGKAQELFPDKTIYLLQAGTKFPSNVSEKVWIRFVPQSMNDAFIEIVRELREFGVLRAHKPLKESSS